MVRFECDHCGAESTRHLSVFKLYARAFCSLSCSHSWNKANPDKNVRVPAGKKIGKNRNTNYELASRVKGLYLVEGNGCWAWLGAFDPHGYGKMWDGRTNVRAHRLMYELHVGEIPNGLVIDHLCRNTACVNPSHLEPVTIRENTLRGFGPASINARKTKCKNGHDFSIENTYVNPQGRRTCRTCQRSRTRK